METIHSFINRSTINWKSINFTHPLTGDKVNSVRLSLECMIVDTVKLNLTLHNLSNANALCARCTQRLTLKKNVSDRWKNNSCCGSVTYFLFQKSSSSWRRTTSSHDESLRRHFFLFATPTAVVSFCLNNQNKRNERERPADDVISA